MNIIRSVFSSVMHETRPSGDGERQEEAGILLLSVLEYVAETKVTQEMIVRSSEVMLDSVQDEVRSCCLELFEGTLLELELEKFYLPKCRDKKGQVYLERLIFDAK